MNSSNSFARRALARSLGLLLLSLLFIAPLTHAQGDQAPRSVSFDVPDPGETITVNLLQLGGITPNEFLQMGTNFQIVPPENSDSPIRDLKVDVVGQYCVTITNNKPDRIGPDDEFSIGALTVFGIPTRIPTRTITYGKGKRAARASAVDGPTGDVIRIAVENVKGLMNQVDPSDKSCLGLNNVPTASLILPPSVPDSDFAFGELVTLDASGSKDADNDPLSYVFTDSFGNILFRGEDPKPSVFLPDGDNTITVCVTDGFQAPNPYPNPDPEQPTLTKTSASASGMGQYAGKGAFRGKRSGKAGYTGGYEGYEFVCTGSTAKATVVVQEPVLTVDLGQDVNQRDTDGLPGERLSFDVSGRTNAPPESDVNFQYFLNPRSDDDDGMPLESNGPVLTNQLFPDGTSRLRVVATLSRGEQQPATAKSTITITVAPPALKFKVKLGDISQGDTDAASGELVTLDVTNSINAPPGVQVTFRFFQDPVGPQNNGKLIFTGPVLSQRFNDGITRLRLVASAEGFDDSDPADFSINVTPPSNALVVANAGEDPPFMPDSDGRLGEVVTLDGSKSMVSDGITATFQWFLNPSAAGNGTLLGSGKVLVTTDPRVPDGRSVIRLVVTGGGQTSTDEVTLTVGARQQATLATLPNLTPNQRRTAVALDDVCSRLLGLETGALTGTATAGAANALAALTSDQRDLTEKCRGIVFNNSVENQVDAVVDITPEDFAVARTQALLFANTQYTSTLDRLIALRGGARGLSLAGLNLVIDGQSIPVAAIQEMFGKIFGSGASADGPDEPGGLLSDRWGMWVRGNYSTGGRDKSLVSPSFDADQTGVTFGTDFRLSRNAVIGASLSYLDSSIDFNPLGEGSLDTESMALSVYGSLYAAKSFYLDGLVNYAKADYDARRNIAYNQGSSLGMLDLDAKGTTDGDTVSAGLFGGYDFLVKGITISPNVGFFYVDATIDGFAESGAGGLNLLYEEQNFKSATANFGFRVNATWSLPWAVLLPGLRFDYIREFEDDVDVFNVRFAADPNGMSTAPIRIQTDNPDTSYYRMSLSLSAQFKFGFAGYIEYQRIDSFNQIDFQDLAFGFRMQRSF